MASIDYTHAVFDDERFVAQSFLPLGHSGDGPKPVRRGR
jgi:hypothetical protein